MPRIHCPAQLAAGEVLALPQGAARHVQVLRMQPGEPLTLFTGEGGEWQATVERMGRTDVQVLVVGHRVVAARGSVDQSPAAAGTPATCDRARFSFVGPVGVAGNRSTAARFRFDEDELVFRSIETGAAATCSRTSDRTPLPTRCARPIAANPAPAKRRVDGPEHDDPGLLNGTQVVLVPINRSGRVKCQDGSRLVQTNTWPS